MQKDWSQWRDSILGNGEDPMYTEQMFTHNFTRRKGPGWEKKKVQLLTNCVWKLLAVFYFTSSTFSHWCRYFPLRPCLNFDSGKNGSFSNRTKSLNELHRYLKTFECKLSSKRIVLKDNQTCGVPRAAYFVRIQNTNKKYNYKYWTTDHVRPHVLQYFVEKRFLSHLVFCYIVVQ